MDDGFKTLVRLGGTHGDAFEPFEFAEEALDQMTLLRVARKGLCPGC
jgi:hypothetical protein